MNGPLFQVGIDLDRWTMFGFRVKVRAARRTFPDLLGIL